MFPCAKGGLCNSQTNFRPRAWHKSYNFSNTQMHAFCQEAKKALNFSLELVCVCICDSQTNLTCHKHTAQSVFTDLYGRERRDWLNLPTRHTVEPTRERGVSSMCLAGRFNKSLLSLPYKSVYTH